MTHSQTAHPPQQIGVEGAPTTATPNSEANLTMQKNMETAEACSGRQAVAIFKDLKYSVRMQLYTEHRTSSDKTYLREKTGGNINIIYIYIYMYICIYICIYICYNNLRVCVCVSVSVSA